MIKRAIAVVVLSCTCISSLSATANDHKSSIAESNTQNAFLAGQKSFSIHINGLTENTSVQNIGFGFTNGHEYNLKPVPSSNPYDTGARIALLGTALSGIVLVRRKLS
jgi:hypothetical protein